MNTPTPGWQPDPMGRHEYRYWDGVSWTDDVSDAGVASHDPMSGAPQYGGGYPPTSPYGSGPIGGGLPPKSGPSPGLLVGLGILLLVLVAGIAFVVSNQDDDDDPQTTNSSNTNSTTTEGGGDGGDDGGDGGGDGGSEAPDELTEMIASGIVASSNGVLTDEEGVCIADAVVNEIGMERLMELGLDQEAASNPLTALEPEELTAVVQSMLDCVPAEKLAEIGASESP